MAVTSMTVKDDDGIYVAVDFNGGLTTAYVYDEVKSISAVGHAKHNPEDEYRWEVGYDLAIARAKSRLYKKIAKQLVKETF